MTKLVFLITLLVSFSAASQARIDIHLDSQSYSIKYFKPFDGFGNFFIPTKLTPNKEGNISISLEIDNPTFVNLIIGNDGLWLLMEPTDKIVIRKASKSKERFDGLTITGNNSLGHIYYNKVFNYYPIDKVVGIQTLFENRRISTETLFERLSTEFKKQIKWVDSLRSSNQITEQYELYMKTEIEGLLAWEVGNLLDKRFPLPKYVEELREAKRKLFSMINPTDEKLKSCGYASGYFYTYYEFLHNQEKLSIDTSQVIIEELSFYALAPLELQRHLWGQDLFVYQRSAPAKYDYCKLFKKYKSTFKTGDYVDYFEKAGLCDNKIADDRIKLMGVQDLDFFSFASENFSGKRVFIDLWATWCGPCKKEFTYYDSSFYTFMQENGVETSFISIDQLSETTQWENEVKALQLQGVHALAGEKLLASLKEIFYPNEFVSIPRYILVNEYGIVISENFRRPSDRGFREELIRLFGN